MTKTAAPPTRFEPPASTLSPPARGFLSLAELADVLIKRWRIWCFTPLATGLIAVAISLLLTPQFRSSAAFFPEVSRSAAGGLSDALGAQAASLGIDIGQGGSKDGELYLDLIHSRDLRERVVTHRYSSASFQGDLLAFFELSGVEPRALAVEKASRELAARARAHHDVVSGVITLSVSTRNPEISQQIVSQFLAELESFNRNQRSSRARERVAFLRRQLEVATQDLARLENTAEQFLERNRAIGDSPSLTFAKARLDRQLAISTGIVTRLQQQLEQSQLELLQETPTISLVDRPSLPQEKIGPRRTLIVITCTMLGAMLGIVLALVAEGVSRSLPSLSPASQSIVARFSARVSAPVRLARRWKRSAS